jgi:hypothetical protein
LNTEAEAEEWTREEEKELKSGVGKVEFFITAATEYEKRRTFVAVYVMHTTGIHIVTAHKHYILQLPAREGGENTRLE